MTTPFHECLACRAGPDRILDTAAEGAWCLTYTSRFQGPPGHVNGGVSMGVFACIAHHAAHRAGLGAVVVERVDGRLDGMVPHGRRLDVDVEVDRDAVDGASVAVAVRSGDDRLVHGTVVVRPAADVVPGDRVLGTTTLLVGGRLGELVDAVELTAERRAFGERRRAERAVGTEDDPFDLCFVCGPAHPSGLGLRSDPIDERRAWIDFEPPADVVTAGRLDDMSAVAALDCTAAASVFGSDVLTDDESMLLGTFAMEFLAVPPAVVPGGYRLPSRLVERDGRRVITDIALLDGEGTPYAVATDTWITVPRT